MEKTVFLDRDGTIIEHIDYIYDCRQVRFIPGVGEAIKLLNENDFKFIIITNPRPRCLSLNQQVLQSGSENNPGLSI